MPLTLPPIGPNDAWGAMINAALTQLDQRVVALENEGIVQNSTLTLVPGNATITANWTAATAASGYTIALVPSSSAGGPGVSASKTGSQLTHTFTGLTNGVAYTANLTIAPSGTVKTATATPVAPAQATVTATPGGGQVTLTWTTVAGAERYRVGRNGVDVDGAGPWEEEVTGNSWVALKLVNGTLYTFSWTPIFANNVLGTTVTRTATPTGPVTPPPASNTVVPLIGKSAMAWNSIVFGHGAQPGAFETWRGRPVDGVMYFPARQSWADMAQLPGRRANDLMVYSVPTFPEGIGGSNAAVASGSYDAAIKNWAQQLINAGWNTNRTCIRLGWENNGTWYQWSWDKGGVENWKNAFRRFVQQCRIQGLTNVSWDWCLNKGPQAYNSGYSWTTAYPGDDVVDVIGIDSYDHWTSSVNESQWTSNVTNKNPGMNDVLAFVKARGKLMSVDEWGVVNGSGGGGDNAWYIGRMFDWLKANAAYIAWDVTYDHEGAPASLNHKLSNGSNPNAAARYRQDYPNGWG